MLGIWRLGHQRFWTSQVLGIWGVGSLICCAIQVFVYFVGMFHACQVQFNCNYLQSNIREEFKRINRLFTLDWVCGVNNCYWKLHSNISCLSNVTDWSQYLTWESGIIWKLHFTYNSLKNYQWLIEILRLNLHFKVNCTFIYILNAESSKYIYFLANYFIIKITQCIN